MMMNLSLIRKLGMVVVVLLFPYREDGRLESKGTYKNGNIEGPWVSYHDNGQLWSKGTFKGEKKVGPFVFYNKDGTVDEKNTGTFKNGVKISD